MVKGRGQEGRGLDLCLVKDTASCAGAVIAGWLREIIEISLHAKVKDARARDKDKMTRKRQRQSNTRRIDKRQAQWDRRCLVNWQGG